MGGTSNDLSTSPTTTLRILFGDARDLSSLEADSIERVVTSPVRSIYSFGLAVIELREPAWNAQASTRTIVTDRVFGTHTLGTDRSEGWIPGTSRVVNSRHH